MKLIVFFSALLLTACSAVPVTVNFPDAPPTLQEICPDLQQTASTDKLSDVMTIVVTNYSLYHECQLKVEAWQEWHKQQKKIFETLK